MLMVLSSLDELQMPGAAGWLVAECFLFAVAGVSVKSWGGLGILPRYFFLAP